MVFYKVDRISVNVYFLHSSFSLKNQDVSPKTQSNMTGTQFSSNLTCYQGVLEKCPWGSPPVYLSSLLDFWEGLVRWEFTFKMPASTWNAGILCGWFKEDRCGLDNSVCSMTPALQLLLDGQLIWGDFPSFQQSYRFVASHIRQFKPEKSPVKMGSIKAEYRRQYNVIVYFEKLNQLQVR